MTAPQENVSGGHDPLGYVEELLDALAQPELDALQGGEPPSTESRRAAFRLAVALGHCRLSGVDPGEHNGILPYAVARAAAEECADQLERWTGKAAELGHRWDETEDAIEGELLCCNFLLAHTDFWAGQVAIDESYQACLRALDPAAAGLRTAVATAVRQLGAFDASLRQQQDLLCLAADTELLENLRDQLAEPYNLDLPWWLDGSLEAALIRVSERSLASQPRQLPRSLASVISEEETGENVPSTIPFPAPTLGRHSAAQPKAAGSAAGNLLDELASQGPTETPTDDYRRAWAHLLASASRGTDHREAWLRRFLDLAAAVAPLDADWTERLRRARALGQNHDWERRLLGEGVLQLEPGPFTSLAALVGWLQELISACSQGLPS